MLNSAVETNSDARPPRTTSALPSCRQSSRRTSDQFVPLGEDLQQFSRQEDSTQSNAVVGVAAGEPTCEAETKKEERIAAGPE